jgi:hypothetical protein
MTQERPPIRIGTTERTAAMTALDDHLAAGRLEIEEYGERSARAANAVTAPELAALFDDLPAPHPQLPGITGPPAPPPVPVHREPSGTEVWGPRLMVLAPVIAVALFLLTRQWFFLLLIPVAGTVLRSKGNHGNHGGDHGGHGRRDG